MFELRKILSDEGWECVKLVLIGGCRNSEDKERIKDLQALCKHLSVEDNVDFKVNISYNELKTEMADGLIGLHTMWNEHFGIAVVEMMASGLITVAHRSGGPLMDIIVEDPNIRNGFLAIHDKEYAASIAHILTNTSSEAQRCIRERARDSVNRFSEKQFEIGWIRTMESLVNSAKT
jgi:alpha-1,2-mannosyltransferase